MITKTGSFVKKKAVLVEVYEEKPKKKNGRLSSKDTDLDQQHYAHHQHHRHDHYVHPGVKQDITIHKDGGGCNPTDTFGKGTKRKAQLKLLQSQSPPPESAQPAKASFLQPKQPNPPPSNNQQPAKCNRSRPPTSGNWKMLLSNFCRSSKSVQVKKLTKKKRQNTGSMANPIQAALKSMEVQKKK